MDSLLPKYYLVKRSLMALISSEEIKPDEAIPSERELMEIHDVSRITVRRAVDELVVEDILYKVQGKGTFVKGRLHDTGLGTLISCTEQIEQQGFKATRKTVSIKRELCSPKIAKIMEIGTDEEVIHIERVYYADGDPVNYNNNYIPVSLFPDFDKFNLDNHSIYNLMESEYGAHIEGSTRYIEAAGAFSNVAKCLQVPKGYPTLLFHGVTRANCNGKSKIVEVFFSNYLTQKIRFFIDQKTKPN